MKPCFSPAILLAISSSFQLLVQIKSGINLDIYAMPRNDTTVIVSVEFGAYIILSCNELAWTTQNSWLIDNGAASGPIQIPDGDPIYWKFENTLSMYVIAAMNGTRYKCDEEAGWIQLSINPMAPYIWPFSFSIKAELGKVLVVRYRVDGFPKPVVDWTRNSDSIIGGGTMFNDTTLIHPVEMSTFSDGFNYTITARNSQGIARRTMQLNLYYLSVSCRNVSLWNRGTTIVCEIVTFPSLKSIVLQRPVGIQQNATTRNGTNPPLVGPGRYDPFKSIVTFVVPETGYGGKYVIATDNGRNTTTTALTIDRPTPTTRAPQALTTRVPTAQAAPTTEESTTQATQASAKNNDEEGGLGWWMYFVIVLACLLVVGFVVVLVIYYKRRQKPVDTAPIVLKVSTIEMPANDFT